MADGDRKRREASRNTVTFTPTEDEGLRFYLQDDDRDKKGRKCRNLVIINQNPELVRCSMPFIYCRFVQTIPTAAHFAHRP